MYNRSLAVTMKYTEFFFITFGFSEKKKDKNHYHNRTFTVIADIPDTDELEFTLLNLEGIHGLQVS